jgi:hypothetical protein
VNAAVAVPRSVTSVERGDENVTKTGKTWVYRDEAAEPAEPERDDEMASDGVMSPARGDGGRREMTAWPEGSVSPDVNKFKSVKTVDKKKKSVAKKRRTVDKEQKSLASLEKVLARKEAAAWKLVKFIEKRVGATRKPRPVVDVVEHVRVAEPVAIQEEVAVAEEFHVEMEESVVVMDRMETVGSPVEEGELRGTDDPLPVERLFSDAELDALEQCEPGQEVTALAGVEVAVEEEEYEKELEERLYPLDEGELQERVKKIAEAKKELSIEEMAGYLGLPVDVLERTKGASAKEMASPEY